MGVKISQETGEVAQTSDKDGHHQPKGTDDSLPKDYGAEKRARNKHLLPNYDREICYGLSKSRFPHP